MYAVVGFPVTPSTVTAFLTILGFSLYDTVVVFDKIRENTRSVATMGRSDVRRDREQVAEPGADAVAVDFARRAAAGRISLLIVGSFILGATSLEEFALALLAGLFIGTYSSIFVATPLLVWAKEREPQYKAMKEQRARQIAETPAPRAARVPVSVGAPTGNGADGDEPTTEPTRAPERGVPGPPAVGRSPIAPRPRQQRGRKRR